MLSQLLRQIIFFNLIVAVVSSMSLLDAYRSEKLTRRRIGMQNTDFRPILHLRGEDDWQKQINDNFSPNQFMDENGIVYDMDPTINDRISTFFNSQKIANSRFGRKKRSLIFPELYF
ncbi:hypothetical protein CAEBREN_14727 [Caenorhabditis brenneri]|uniref:Uncharacterized protein n=1 Tax=Caenorhabditis brenneri TaxID=135651 RepID=G0M6Z7_CAEBE|nr:hypothetical protein CAEBREN_14727 [Caenorhabditis brenneri]